MPYTVSCSPAPLTFTVRPRFGWYIVPSIVWGVFLAYGAVSGKWRHFRSDVVFDTVVVAFGSLAALLSLIRRERIEIYPDQMVWRKTYFGFTRSQSAPLADVLGAAWNEGNERGREGKGPDYVEFYLPDKSVKACFGCTFEEFDQMREEIRKFYPAVVARWGQASMRSKDFTLLNLN